MADLSPICNFYQNRSVFITGGTGFMGKVLVEKLLRSCHKLNKIYLLMRAKRGKSPYERLEAFLNLPIFDLVRAEATGKLQLIEGDLQKAELGVRDEDVAILARDVSVVFHCAATVRFAETLKEAILLNVLGTRHVLEMCKKFDKLESLVHVSTAYTNCDRAYISEVIYPSRVPYNKILDLSSWMEPEMLEAVTRQLVGSHPNTYTFTKLLAENLVQAECGALPVAIVRPCIVTSTWREPVPGYVDTLSGVNAMISAGSTGMLRTMLVHEEKAADLIPADVAINLMIAVSWYTAVHRPNSLMVYNCTPEREHRETWGKILRTVMPYFYQYPHQKIFRCPAGSFQRVPFMNTMVHYVDHLAPALVADVASVLLARKPVMIKLYQKVSKIAESFNFFATREWIFQMENSALVQCKMTEQDRKVFYLNIKGIDWQEFWKDNILGNRKYVFKEDLSTLPKARRSLMQRYWLSFLPSILLAVVLCHQVAVRRPQLRLQFVGHLQRLVSSLLS